MNKPSISAGTLSQGLTAADVTQSLLQRWLKNLRSQGNARPKAEPMTAASSQLIEEEEWNPGKDHSPIYDLAASHPNVIAASLFSGAAKRR
jgi:hypothetical protein